MNRPGMQQPRCCLLVRGQALDPLPLKFIGPGGPVQPTQWARHRKPWHKAVVEAHHCPRPPGQTYWSPVRVLDKMLKCLRP